MVVAASHPPPFSSLNIMRYGSKTRLSCRKILMLLSIDGSKSYILIVWATPRICEDAEYEPEASEGCAYLLKTWTIPKLTPPPSPSSAEGGTK